MYGALLGDQLGAPYELGQGKKTKDFPLFPQRPRFTDETVMSIALAQAMINSLGVGEGDARVIFSITLRRWGRRYPYAGYSGDLKRWFEEGEALPYESDGREASTRVSCLGWLFDSLEETRRYARLSARVTQSHPQAQRGAEALSSAIFLAREGENKEEIRDFVTRTFGYDLSRSCDQIRPSYQPFESCQKTVPEAITAFLEGKDFEDVLRNALSLGGAGDALGCMAGALAEAYYGVDTQLKEKCVEHLPLEMRGILERFDGLRREKKSRRGS